MSLLVKLVTKTMVLSCPIAVIASSILFEVRFGELVPSAKTTMLFLCMVFAISIPSLHGRLMRPSISESDKSGKISLKAVFAPTVIESPITVRFLPVSASLDLLETPRPEYSS